MKMQSEECKVQNIFFAILHSSFCVLNSNYETSLA